MRRSVLPEAANAPESRTRDALIGLVVEAAMAVVYMLALVGLTAVVVWL